MTSKDFLFELGCEELPSQAVSLLSTTLADNTTQALNNINLSFDSIISYATPRRLGMVVKSLAIITPSLPVVRRGPALIAAYDSANQPTKALLGFAKSCGVALDLLTTLKTDQGEWIVYQTLNPGVKTAELLPELMANIVLALPHKKVMRWGQGASLFARPVHWMIMLLGQQHLTSRLFDITADKYSYGHRFHAPQAIFIKQACDYETALKNAYVIADFAKRRAMIVKQINQQAKNYHATAIISDTLLDEVCAIVEWPQAVVASFDEKFLTVPSEVLIAAMQVHQKSFALQDAQGHLMPYFITISNITSNNPAQVIRGNEKVMRARLSDAAFFFEQDQQLPLKNAIATTAKVIFQEKLGSLFDKAQRMSEIMAILSPILALDLTLARRAAQLSKCDLMTAMVGEFPALQGVMGYYYALASGEHHAVAVALKEQYLPAFAYDSLPQSPLGWALAFAERLDTLVGIFAIGLKPKADNDPFKLRRHAQAVVRLLIDQPIAINLLTLIKQSHQCYGAQLPENNHIELLLAFILERLPAFYQKFNINTTIIQAVLVQESQVLVDVDRRIKAVASFINQPQAQQLLTMTKRVSNLLQSASITDHQQVDNRLLLEPAEQCLYHHIVNTEKMINKHKENHDYTAVLHQLIELQPMVDNFFEQVMVMTKDIALKTNRLQLLCYLQTLLCCVADLSLISC